MSELEIDMTASDVHDKVNVSQNNKEVEIDESLYSRQLYVLGREAQHRMSSSNVILIGCNGVGVEIAKNLILAGIHSLTLYDPTVVSYYDLASHFYVREEQVGKISRAKASIQQLSELNPYVKVSLKEDPEITETSLNPFQLVICVNQPYHENIRINQLCRALSIAFITTGVYGVYGMAFCDFGQKFITHEKDNKQPMECMIASISNTNPAVITVTEDSRHGLETGDAVTFREIEGPYGTILNQCQPKKIEVLGPFTFSINLENAHEKDIIEQNLFIPGHGYFSQVKQPVELSFRTFQECLNDPCPDDMLISDYGKLGHSEILHIGFLALNEFQNQHKGKLPDPTSIQNAEEVYELTKKINRNINKNGELYVEDFETNPNAKNLIFTLSFGSQGVISPMAALFGGIVAQEALKACTLKFSPIKQFFYFDAVETLPKERLSIDSNEIGPDMADFQPRQCRYDSQIIIFGNKVQEALNCLRMFLVGAGAIGCEMLKNWALMGIGTGTNSKIGEIYVTDMDRIEKSNLNRQFLFRNHDVQEFKSSTACKAVKRMNPAIKVHPYQLRVGLETDEIFNDDFYGHLNGICTALDNVEARLYMDQKSLFYQLPMFESGTLGTCGNTQVIVPFITENYGASRDPPEKSIPICTLKNFPNAIEHTLQWARDWYEGIFFQVPGDVNSYLSSPKEFLANLETQLNRKREIISKLYENLVRHKAVSFDDCIAWARLQFEEMFSNQIKQLLHNFPLDHLTSNGTLFWSGPKRPPTPLVFDVEDETHMQFIISAANSRAINYGLVGRKDKEYFKMVLSKVQVPEFVPKTGVKIASTDEEAQLDADEGEPIPGCEVDYNALPSPSSLAGYRLVPIEFDKDNDAHMEVIVAVSNLRARNYKIGEADMHKSRFIAGKIIPAIATTTALVTGLVCLEILKVYQKKPLESYKNAFVNLALPLFTFSEPLVPKKTEATFGNKEEISFTAWDRLEIVDTKNEMTLKKFLNYFEEKYKVEVSMVSSGITMLYTAYGNKAKLNERLPMTMVQLMETISKKKLPVHQKYLVLEVAAVNEEGDDVELPYIRYQFKQ